MTYYSNLELETWFENRKNRTFWTTIFSIFLFAFMVFGMYLESDKQISKKFIVGLSGVLAIFIFSIFIYFRNARIVNNTIREVDITDTGIIFRTFSFKIMNMYMMHEKQITVDFFNLAFLQFEYPLNDVKNNLERKCYKLLIEDEEFYLLVRYFEDNFGDWITEHPNGSEMKK